MLRSTSLDLDQLEQIIDVSLWIKDAVLIIVITWCR